MLSPELRLGLGGSSYAPTRAAVAPCRTPVRASAEVYWAAAQPERENL
jgi:hypothetical protein